MRHFARNLIFALACLSLFHVFSASGRENGKKEWTGKLVDGTMINKRDLAMILSEHKKWLETKGAQGKRANLRYANLQGAFLEGASLQEADLRGANLHRAYFREANLQGADLGSAGLQGADLLRANLQEAKLGAANLQGANLRYADLREASLRGAFLQEADLSRASLQEADLLGANLHRAYFREANLQETDLWRANLSFVLFEPKLGSLPDIASVATARNLSLLTYSELPHGLTELREAFKKAGFRKQEREITYAIRRTQRAKSWKQRGITGKIESLFNLILFEITCQYGMSPGRPLLILCLLILGFVFPYMIVLTRNGKDGIWRAWSSDRIRKDLGEKNPERITVGVLRAYGIGFYFSILSAFHIGWRDLNVGNWIARIQKREYTLRATGWARFISGIQSLISVYLLALWALTYFGRPFE